MADDVLDVAARALQAEYKKIWPGSWPALPEAKQIAQAVIDALPRPAGGEGMREALRALDGCIEHMEWSTPQGREAYLAASKASRSLHRALTTGTGERNMKSLQARIDMLHALQDSDPARYASREVQADLRSLYASLYELPKDD